MAPRHGPPWGSSRFAAVGRRQAFAEAAAYFWYVIEVGDLLPGVDVGLLAVVGLEYGKWCQYLLAVPIISLSVFLLHHNP